MIRLREALESGCRHRYAGPIFLILLAVLLFLIVLHATHDAIDAGSAAVCLFLVMVSFAVPMVRALGTRLIVLQLSRGSPRLTLPVRLVVAERVTGSPPLRL